MGFFRHPCLRLHVASFRARGWIFTNSLSTMLVTLPAERFAKYHYSLTSWKKDTSLSIANYAIEPEGIS
jgi:hypothetical protein